MYTDFNQIKKEIDNYMSQGYSRLNAEWKWLEAQGVGVLEKRNEGEIEVEKFVISNSQEFWKATQTLRSYFNWRYGLQERDKEKTNELL